MINLQGYGNKQVWNQLESMAGHIVFCVSYSSFCSFITLTYLY